MTDPLSFAGDGKASCQLREFDWGASPLGLQEQWPATFRFLLSLILASPEAMWFAWGPERLFFFNNAYVPQLGNKLTGAIGRRFADVWADVYKDVRDAIDQTFAGTASKFTERPLLMARDGSGMVETFWTFSFSPVRSEQGEIVALLCTAMEETQRKEREREGSTALRLYQDIVRSDPNPVCAFDARHAVIAFNQAFSDEFFRVYGHRARLGDTFPELFLPDQGLLIGSYLDRALAGEDFTVTQRFGHPDHAVPMWEISYNPLRDAEGHIVGAVQHGVDINDRVRAEQELAEAQEQLRQSQKLEAIGQLTGGVAHDFNNLLTVIRGSVDLLRRDNLPAEKRGRYIDAIGITAERAAKLTSQLLAFARRQSLRSEVFDAGSSLEEVATMVRTMTGSRIVLVIKVPEAAFFIDADRSQFDTAIINMGINARDAMKGEGHLTIAMGPVSGIPALRGHAAQIGDFVAFTIADTGSGIPADVVERIFEPFFTTKGVGEGTGLGLSQVIGFAKQSGGDIKVDSVPGKGTTFTLYLPRAYPDGSEAIDLEAIERVDGEGVCVLVVEDNAQVGEFATAALAELGYDSVLATDGRAALGLLREDCDRFHVIFSDVVMPGMGGIELGGEVRRLYPDVPIILTSGYSHVLAQNGQHGFELLHKPYSVEQLSHVLRKAITWQVRKRAFPVA
ncbi:PAS domain-containing protein [Sphingomonas sp. BK345]|uniref:PAS domain-containing protein n=1 Tax=Sphingomonas sp. BK345 TaxID=2586980 RepID=UPI00161CC881|nr:PAS domain-containing protein [Sphingomonas sp. BK345]MBB3472764.1 signal transduction histidine kinase/CheY-like chemotaxis protein [Sphingomonas sp. BK345]